MHIPTFVLEGIELPRVILSIQPSKGSDVQETVSLMKTSYEMGALCFDLPTKSHLEAFRELKNLVEEESLIGLSHVEAGEGASLLGKPLHHFAPKIASTIKKNLFPPQLVTTLKKEGVWSSKFFFPTSSSAEVFTQKEIDRIRFDADRFDKALFNFRQSETPFLVIGRKYGDWLSALGRIDLLQSMVARARERGFRPIFYSYWTTFVLPKTKTIDVAAYAVPINKRWSLFDPEQAFQLIKKFDRPVIGFNPFAEGELMQDSEEAFSFLFQELRIHGAIVEVTSKEEVTKTLNAIEAFPSIIHRQKT
jgi:hypothetical protein